jgi:hypothetical protein
VNVSNEQPPVREVVPYKSGKRPSTFRRLKIDFAGTALEEALNEQEERKREQELSDTRSALSITSEEEWTNHQLPPVTTTPHHTLLKDIEDSGYTPIDNKINDLITASDALPLFHAEESPPVTTTPQSQVSSNKSSIAPARDFNRRANSLDRDALPSGLFPGSTKKVYDALYLRTRGAIVPVKAVRASRRDLLMWTGIRNLKTIDNHIRYLMAIGLIVRDWELGSNEGSSYEVRLPEEIANGSPSLVGSGGESPPVSTTPQNTGSGYTQKLGSGGEGQIVDNTNIYKIPKTSFKTNTDDDETHTLGKFTARLIEAARRVVGGELVNSELERERWNELGKLLADELQEAAERTDSISSVPAFFTAHLRRRLAHRQPVAEIKKPPEASQKTYQDAAALQPEQKSGVKGSIKATVPETQATGRSKFSMEECRRYADHLHKTGQGITNPGGFAMTIYRSGISDAGVEKFIHPDAQVAIDASACETCRGTGFYYPRGVAEGVVKCKHEALMGEGARRRLTPEEITEQATVIGELLESGYPMEQAEDQFAASVADDDWAMIRARLLVEKKSL